MDKDARIARLEAEVAELKRLLAAALDENARLKRTSRTSSKPPSSDIVKPPLEASSQGSKGASGPSGKRKPGGQPGHDKNTRVPYTAEQIDAAYVYDFLPGDRPGVDWELLDDFHVLQQIELRENPLHITEHRFMRYRHKKTGRVIHAPVPRHLQKQGLLGPRLRATAALLKGQCHVSYRPMQGFFRDVLGLAISTGLLAKVVGQCGDALADPYDALSAKLVDEPVVNVDETGHREARKSWLWCAVGRRLSVFKIVASRAARVLEDLLGPGYGGVVASDFFSAYRKFAKDYPASVPAYCWAHLVREVRYLTTLSDKVIVRWATKLLNETKRLFKAYHTQGQRAQHNARDAILKCVRRPPSRKQAQTLAERIRTHADAYFLFLKDDRVEPTNNKAERALRHAVIDRRISQGTRGPTGSRWLERFLSIRETCRQQDRPLFDYLVQAISQHTAGKPVPELV